MSKDKNNVMYFCILTGMTNYWHGGGIYSYYSLVNIFPETNMGLFISINGYKGCSEHKIVETHLRDCPCGSNGFSIIEPMAYFITDILNNDQMWLNLTTQCTYPQPWTSCGGQQKNEDKKYHINTINYFKKATVTEKETTPLTSNINSLEIFQGIYSNSLLGDSLVILNTNSPYCLYFKIRWLTGFLHRHLEESDLSFWLECDQHYRFLRPIVF
ncbi:hypothetical protein Btru_003540 [Bulinus truncatus]|nr:hypothetical protein Btru_003540 [Bulinus truncatus]